MLHIDLLSHVLLFFFTVQVIVSLISFSLFLETPVCGWSP